MYICTLYVRTNINSLKGPDGKFEFDKPSWCVYFSWFFINTPFLADCGLELEDPKLFTRLRIGSINICACLDQLILKIADWLPLSAYGRSVFITKLTNEIAL